MKLIVGGLVGFLTGSVIGWLGFGSVPGAIGSGFAVAASILGFLFAVGARTKT